MAAMYTASTITIFLNVVGSYFWRLNDNARIITLINILVKSLCRFEIDVATP